MSSRAKAAKETKEAKDNLSLSGTIKEIKLTPEKIYLRIDQDGEELLGSVTVVIKKKDEKSINEFETMKSSLTGFADGDPIQVSFKKQK